MYVRETDNYTKLNKSVFIMVFLSIFLGGVIYFLWRPETIRFFNWLDMVGLSSSVDFIRIYGKQSLHFIPTWVIFSLPNGLWTFSYTLLILHIWLDHNSSLKYLWFVSIPVVGVGYEILQCLEVIPGTFCIEDLFLCTVGILLGVITAYIIKRRL